MKKLKRVGVRSILKLGSTTIGYSGKSWGRTDQDSEEDPFEVEQRMKWQEEEEKKQELTISK